MLIMKTTTWTKPALSCETALIARQLNQWDQFLTSRCKTSLIGKESSKNNNQTKPSPSGKHSQTRPCLCSTPG